MTIFVKVTVTPNSKREIVEKIHDDSFRISVREKAERNMANIRIRELLALEYGVDRGKVRILTGHHAPSKICTVERDVI